MKTKECPKCGRDISETYQSEEPDVGIYAGWYCDACDFGVGDDDEHEFHNDDVPLFGMGKAREPWLQGVCDHCRTPLELGYGLAGGGIGPYMYCPNPHCKKPTFIKSQDPA